MRQTIRKIEINTAYRWFIGYDIDEAVPHFSTFGKNYSRRFAGTKYQEQLDAEVEADRAAHGKKPLKTKDDDDETLPPSKIITESVRDPECWLFHNGEHEKQFAYVSNTACERNGFVLDFEVTPANLHDSVTFDDLYKRVASNYPEANSIAADSAYKTPYIMKLIFDSGK